MICNDLTYGTYGHTGYDGEKCIDALENNERVVQYRFAPFEPSNWLARLPYALRVILKLIVLALKLLFALFRASYELGSNKADHGSSRRQKKRLILVQTPPALPTLPIAWLVGRLTGARVLVDWHNLGHTCLSYALRKKQGFSGKRLPFTVNIYRLLEHCFGALTDAHICVTRALQQHLAAAGNAIPRGVDSPPPPPKLFAVAATTLHDRPLSAFKRISDVATKHELFRRLDCQLGLREAFFGGSDVGETTAFTVSAKQLRPDRPALVVSSTSWSDDEDLMVSCLPPQTYQDRLFLLFARVFHRYFSMLSSYTPLEVKHSWPKPR